MSRTLAVAAILATAFSGSGLPMCISLVAHAAQPCAMREHASEHAGHGPQVVAGHAQDDACHGQDGDLGCATGGSCPTGGTPAPLAAEAVLATSGPVYVVTPAVAGTHLSFLSPPLPPPPQA